MNYPYMQIELVAEGLICHRLCLVKIIKYIICLLLRGICIYNLSRNDFCPYSDNFSFCHIHISKYCLATNEHEYAQIKNRTIHHEPHYFLRKYNTLPYSLPSKGGRNLSPLVKDLVRGFLLVQSSSIEPNCFCSGYNSEPARTIRVNSCSFVANLSPPLSCENN